MGLFEQTTLAEQAARDNEAMQIAKLPAGRSPVYYAAQAAGDLGRGVGGLFGIKSKAEELALKKDKVRETIFNALPDDLATNPKTMYKGATMLLRAGETEMAHKMMEAARKLTEAQKTTTGKPTDKQRWLSMRLTQCPAGDTACQQKVYDDYDAMMMGGKSGGDGGTMAQYMNSAAAQVENDDGTLGCDWRKDAGCAQKASVIAKEFKRTGAGETGARRRAIGEANLLTETQDKIYQDADMADSQIATIDQSLALLDEGVFTGTGGDLVAGMATLLATFGLAEPDIAAGAEMYMVNSMKSVMGWVAQTKGAISGKEMTSFIGASPGLSKTEAGNRLILGTMREAAKFKVREEREFNNYISINPQANIRSWKAHRRNWVKENGIKFPTKAEIDAAMKGDTGIPKVSVDIGEGSMEVVPENQPSRYTVEIVE